MISQQFFLAKSCEKSGDSILTPETILYISYIRELLVLYKEKVLKVREGK